MATRLSPLRNTAELRKGTAWKLALLAALANASAPRVFTARELQHWVRAHRPSASTSTVFLVSELLVTAGALHRVSSGIFLNLRAIPPAELAEAARHLRNGAIISLHSVLGESGFLNNPSTVVTAVVPSSADRRPRLGELRTSGGDIFRFYGLAEKFFPANAREQEDLLQPGRACAVFRPEAALLQWLHLAALKRSTLTTPPFDVDMDQLDADLLNRLAGGWGLETQLREWQAAAEKANFGEPTERVVPLTLPSTQTQLAGQAARARLMARRRS